MLMPCTACASGMDRAALRIDVAVEDAAGREAVDQLDAADLDDAVLARIEAGGFGVEDDLAHRITPRLRHDMPQALQASAAPPAAFPRAVRAMMAWHRLARRIQACAGVDDEIGALALFGVGHLPGQDRLELFRRHAGPRQHALALDLGRRGDDHDLVDAVACRRSRTAAGCRARRAARRRRDGARGTHRHRRGPADGRSLPAASSAAGLPSTRLASFGAVDDAV